MVENDMNHLPDNEAEGVAEAESDVLIGRLVDGEASREERRRFEDLADDDQTMWRSLALRQLDMQSLAGEFAETIGVADRVEAQVREPRRWTGFAVTLSGWAAMFALAMTWLVAVSGRVDPAQPITQPGPATRVMTAQEHLDAYLQAPHVLGEMDLLLLETEHLGDGRYRHRFLRRIEESVVNDAESFRPGDAPVRIPQ